MVWEQNSLYEGKQSKKHLIATVSQVSSSHCISLSTADITGHLHRWGLPNKDFLILFLHLSLLKDTVIQSLSLKDRTKNWWQKLYDKWWTFFCLKKGKNNASIFRSSLFVSFFWFPREHIFSRIELFTWLLTNVSHSVFCKELSL